MPNTSATGGYLAPVGAVPADDLDLDVLLQGAVAGITGLPGEMVRPRWQPVTPRQPEPNENWCAIGIASEQPENTPSIEHDPGSGTSTLKRHPVFEVLASFYGPAAGRYAATLRDGLYIPQNREPLRAAGVAVVSIGDAISAPDLVNQQWVRRRDVRITLRRVTVRTYPGTLTISSAEVLGGAAGGPSFDLPIHP